MPPKKFFDERDFNAVQNRGLCFKLFWIKSHHDIAPALGTCDGITLEPALAFRYIAGKHIAGHAS
jgi:hypothetical protein